MCVYRNFLKTILIYAATCTFYKADKTSSNNETQGLTPPKTIYPNLTVTTEFEITTSQFTNLMTFSVNLSADSDGEVDLLEIKVLSITMLQNNVIQIKNDVNLGASD